MEHAVEQRQLNTEWKYSQFHAKKHVQSLPWLVNAFFLKNEGLLPRAEWDAENGCWRDNPYNVPELPEVYPESSNFGILPAYGLFAKHVDGLTLKNVRFSWKVPDERHVCVFDDADGVSINGLEACCKEGLAPVVTVTDHYRRHTNAENVPEQPYFTTKVTGLSISEPFIIHAENDFHVISQLTDLGQRDSTVTPSSENLQTTAWIQEVEIHAPAPGTPPDSLYPYPTVPCMESGYRFMVDTDDYPLPLTVYRPFIHPIAPVQLAPGQAYSVILTVRNPASDISEEADDGIIYNEQVARLNYGVKGMDVPLTLGCKNLPDGAVFEPDSRRFSWTPRVGQQGKYEIVFVVNDGVLPEEMTLKITVN